MAIPNLSAARECHISSMATEAKPIFNQHSTLSLLIYHFPSPLQLPQVSVASVCQKSFICA